MRNLEIKTPVASLSPIRTRLRRLPGAAHDSSVAQTDWYFQVPRGRMKLREIAAGRARRAELILYFRPDRNTARTSEFLRLPVADCRETLRAFTRTFGLRTSVHKRREVWLFENARIHLDRVAGLGTFVEIEVVVTAGTKQAHALMRTLVTTLGLNRADFVAGSYSNLLAERGRTSVSA